MNGRLMGGLEEVTAAECTAWAHEQMLNQLYEMPDYLYLHMWGVCVFDSRIL